MRRLLVITLYMTAFSFCWPSSGTSLRGCVGAMVVAELLKWRAPAALILLCVLVKQIPCLCHKEDTHVLSAWVGWMQVHRVCNTYLNILTYPAQKSHCTCEDLSFLELFAGGAEIRSHLRKYRLVVALVGVLKKGKPSIALLFLHYGRMDCRASIWTFWTTRVSST